MQLDYELLSSLINEDRIIQEIKAIKVSKSDTDVKELVESLLSSLAMIKKTKSSYTKRQALAKLVKDAGDEVVGMAIAIEKSFQPGRERLENAGFRVESLVRIKEFKDNKCVFIED